jgi:peroxiredoxin
MKGSKPIFFIIAMLLLFTTTSLSLFSLEVGDQAPAFVLTDLNRNYIFSRNIYGKGWVLVDFYATWCDACNEELPYLEDLYERRGGDDFHVVVMATDTEGSATVKPFFDQRTTPLLILLDRYQKSVESFGVTELPTVFLVDPQGFIVYKSSGFHEGLIEEIEAKMK